MYAGAVDPIDYLAEPHRLLRFFFITETKRSV